MVNNVMFLPWKLIFQKTNTKKLILVVTVILVVAILICSISYSCGMQHVLIINEIALYEKSLDPEFCEMIVEKIDLFNDECKPEIEILDCG